MKKRKAVSLLLVFMLFLTSCSADTGIKETEIVSLKENTSDTQVENLVVNEFEQTSEEKLKKDTEVLSEALVSDNKISYNLKPDQFKVGDKFKDESEIIKIEKGKMIRNDEGNAWNEEVSLDGYYVSVRYPKAIELKGILTEQKFAYSLGIGIDPKANRQIEFIDKRENFEYSTINEISYNGKINITSDWYELFGGIRFSAEGSKYINFMKSKLASELNMTTKYPADFTFVFSTSEVTYFIGDGTIVFTDMSVFDEETGTGKVETKNIVNHAYLVGFNEPESIRVNNVEYEELIAGIDSNQPVRINERDIKVGTKLYGGTVTFVDDLYYRIEGDFKMQITITEHMSKTIKTIKNGEMDWYSFLYGSESSTPDTVGEFYFDSVPYNFQNDVIFYEDDNFKYDWEMDKIKFKILKLEKDISQIDLSQNIHSDEIKFIDGFDTQEDFEPGTKLIISFNQMEVFAHYTGGFNKAINVNQIK